VNPAVTIVLPVHNVERTLRGAILRMLDLAEILGRRVQVAVVDDGSTDGTYEMACELSRQFPQIVALRRPFQSGLGPALQQVRQRLGVENVVAHDGVTPIDLDQLAEVLTAPSDAPPASHASWSAAIEGRGSRRAAAIPMARRGKPHGDFGSFRWLRLDDPLAPRRARSATTTPSVVRAGVAAAALASSANTFTAAAAGLH
jgi:glycosyltransferase involved in cell wall biosynthesis